MTTETEAPASNVTSIFRNEHHDTYLALCLNCMYRWVATISISESKKLFALKCPQCHKCDSFVSLFNPLETYNGN